MTDKTIDSEDLQDLLDPDYIESIKKSREEYKNGEVFTIEEVFDVLLND